MWSEIDLPKTSEEKSVSESLEWLVLVTEMEIMIVGAFNYEAYFFIGYWSTNVVSKLLLLLQVLEPFFDPKRKGNQKAG